MKKRLVLGAAVVAVLSLVAGGLWYYLLIRPEIIARAEAAVDACADCVFTLSGEQIYLSDQFADSPDTDDMTGKRASITTVRRKLIGLRAYCKDGQLYDGRDKRVIFFRIAEWGPRPWPEWEEQAHKQHEKALHLEQEGWTVISMWHVIRPV
jgi:hypothetical protein